MITDTALQIYRYKIAVDYGNAYHFRFEEPLPDDPYGPMVDRCARIAEITRAGTALCSDEYRRQLGGSCAYVSVGKFSLRGFPDPEELFLRSLVEVDSAAYLKPLISAVNEQDPHVQGYRFVGRKLTTEFVRDFGQDDVRPFLARELLSIPKLPHSPKEFSDVVGEAGNIEEKEREFIGYFVEWEGTFEGFTSDRNRIVLTLEVATPSVSDHYFHILLVLPHSNLEIVKALRKGQLLRARGIIQDITFHMIRLNYVDLETVDEGGVACE